MRYCCCSRHWPSALSVHTGKFYLFEQYNFCSDLAQNDEISPIHAAFRPQSDNQQRRDENDILITDRQLLDELLVLEEKINILREWFDDFHPETYSPESKIIVSNAGHYSPHDCELV